jgi:hypothetical protein
MKVNGCDCSIVIKTAHCEMDVPYSEETIREAVSILQEEAAIEGDGVCRGIKKASGVRGCVVTPLTIGTAPLLLYLAMGSIGKPVFVSETRNLYKRQLHLLPLEDTERFDLVQDRRGMSNEQLGMSNERRLFEGCRVENFELRIMRGETIKLKLDICGERSPKVYPYTDNFEREQGERFSGDFTSYWINGKEYKNIYGLTLSCKKEGSTKTEIWIRRVLEKGEELPNSIEELVISARLIKDKYEYRHFGMFRITLKRLVFVSDGTIVESTDAVIGSVKYCVFGTVLTDVFTSTEEILP